jgi:hypothetical protein
MAAKSEKSDKPEKKAPPRPKRTKAETEARLEDIRAEAQSRESVDQKSAAAARVREEEVRDEVADVGVETVVERISWLGLDVYRALSDLAERLTAEVRLLATL